MCKDWKLVFKKNIAVLLQRLLYWIPLKCNRIMFYAHNRQGIVDNPAFLLRYLQQYFPDHYELLWITTAPDSCTPLPNVKIVGRRSLQYFRYYIRTKIYISNDMIDEWLIKKKGQIYLTTWHGGGAYKQIGKQVCSEDSEFIKNYDKLYNRLDYFVASCKKSAEIFQSAMKLPDTIFLPYGSPRNDMFFHNTISQAAKVRNFYHISSSQKILLYAPSFFQATVSQNNMENFPKEQLLKTLSGLEEITGESWICLARHHYFTSIANDIFDFKILNGNLYHEMQDLLCASDILVTDFSSSIWDMGLQHKPVIVLQDAITKYEETDRGFFIPPEMWPYLQAKNIEDIVSVYQNFHQNEYLHDLDVHYSEMGSYENGTACKQLTALLQKLTQGS